MLLEVKLANGALSAVVFISLARYAGVWYAWGFFVLYLIAVVTYYALKLRSLRRNPNA